ncbi:hypothetical protein JOM56_000738 [Amanita muscaria]
MDLILHSSASLELDLILLFHMNLPEQFSTLQITTMPLGSLHLAAKPGSVPSIEFSSDTESDNRNVRAKDNTLTKRTRKLFVKGPKLFKEELYYSDGREVTDSEDSDSDSEMVTEPDHEWVAFVKQHAASSAARAATRAAARVAARAAARAAARRGNVRAV